MARELRSAVVALTALCVCSCALADPITIAATLAPIIGGAAVDFIFAYGTYIAGATLVLYTASENRRKARAQAEAAKASYNASLQDRNVTLLSNEAPWKSVYGSPAPLGGAVVAILTSGARDQYKHLVIVYAAHESQAIDEVYIEGEAVGALDGSGWCVSGSPFYETLPDQTITELIAFDSAGVGTASHSVGSLLTLVTTLVDDVTTNYAASASGTTITAPGAANLSAYASYTYQAGNARVNVQKHLSPGGVDTADAFLIAAAPANWTPAHKLSGYTYLVVTLDLNFGKFQGGPPNVTVKMRGKKDVYDFRTATTGYTNNPALCTADFIASSFGMGATRAQIDAAAAIVAANACDAQGFTCDGVIDTSNARDANLQQLEDCMAGSTHFSGGVWRMLAGAWSSPVMTLDGSTLAGPIDVVQASHPAEGRFNGVRGQYVPASGLGVSTDITPYSVASYVAADGVARVKPMSFQFTATNAACQKLAAIAVERSRLGLTINYPAHFPAWKLQPGDRVSVTNDELGFSSKTFRLVDYTYIANAPIGLVLTEDSANVYTGTFNTPDYQLATSNLKDPWARPDAPAGVVAQSGTGILQRRSDGTIVTRVLVSWTAATNRYVLQGGYVQVQWRNAAATDDQWNSVDLAPDATNVYLTGPQDGAAILVRVRFVASTGQGIFGTWSTISHLVVGKTAPPAAPGYVAATQALVFWGAVTDVDLAGYRIRAFPGSSGAVWSRATPLHNDLLTTGPYVLSTKLYGLQTIMVVSEDTTGNQSPAVSALVDFGAPDISNAVQTKDYSADGYPGTRTSCSVSGTNLQATTGSDLYALGDVYGEADVYATTYNAMTWVSDPFAPAYQGGTLTLAQTTVGGSVSIEYQIDGSTTNDAYSSADVYAEADLYGASSSFAAWPGALQVNRMQGVIFRVSIAGGATQGVISAFAPSLVMPDVRQTFGNTLIAAAGTRLAPSAGTPPRNWIAIKSVQMTPIVDGSGAIGGRILDFNNASGPLVQTVDITGTAVTGRNSVDLVGLADG